MAWGYRASSFAATGSITYSASLSTGAAVSLGDRIVLGVMTRKTTPAPGIPSITDNVNGSTTYTEDTFTTFSDGSSLCRASVCSLANSAAGTPSITVVSSGSVGGFMAAAYSGLLTTDPGNDGTPAAANGVGNAQIQSSGNTAATTAANELVVGVYLDSGWGWTPILAGTGLTSRGTHANDSSNYQGMIEDKDSGSSGVAQAATVGTNSGNGPPNNVTYGMLAVVYKLAAGAPPDPFPLLLPGPTQVRYIVY